MRHTMLTLFVLLMCACNEEKVQRLEQQNQELTGKLEALSKASNLDLQEKCAKQARSVFSEMGFNKEPLANYTNHYQQRLNKCFIAVYNMKYLGKVPTIN